MENSAKILEFLKTIGCEFPEIGLLQPADPFLDSTGEDLRRRIFLTQENSGTLHCLRPEFTIPVCLAHRAEKTLPQCYGYCGTVFRQRSNASHEFVQAGYEDIGKTDRAQADVDCIKHAIALLEHLGEDAFELVIGNQWIFAIVLEELDIPMAWRKKLLRAFGDPAILHNVISGLGRQEQTVFNDLPKAVQLALKSKDQDALVREVTTMMLEAGLPLTGSRTPKAIAERLMQQAELNETVLSDEKRSLLETYLAIECDLASAADVLGKFAQNANISLDVAQRSMSDLANGLQGHKAFFKAGFGRRIDYYSGMVFEVSRKEATQPLVGGGRYDQLMTVLGSDTEIPAVGFAIWLERLGDKA